MMKIILAASWLYSFDYLRYLFSKHEYLQFSGVLLLLCASTIVIFLR